jgi:hypothetical protein
VNQENDAAVSFGFLRKAFATFGMLVAVMGVIGIFIGLCYLVGITDYWPAFIFVLYWGMIDSTDLKKLPRCIVGAFVGLLAVYLMQKLPHLMGSSGGIAALGFVMILVIANLWDGSLLVSMP